MSKISKTVLLSLFLNKLTDMAPLEKEGALSDLLKFMIEKQYFSLTEFKTQSEKFKQLITDVGKSPADRDSLVSTFLKKNPEFDIKININ